MAEKKIFEVEVAMWVRGKVLADTEEEAVDAIMDLMYVEEDKLDEMSDNDYDVSLTGSAAGLTGADLDRMRRDRRTLFRPKRK